MKFNDLQEEWDATPEKGILPQGAKMRMWQSIEKATTQRNQRSRYQWFAAACALLLLSIGGYQIFDTFSAQAQTIVATQTYPDDIRLLRLPDGSRVWVNQNTKIEYPETFTGNTRNVVLEGEAYFDVAKDKSKPFIITSGKITTTVVGTSFSITSYKGTAPRVNVRSGKVRVKGENNEVILVKGYSATYLYNTSTLQKHTINVMEPDWKKALIDIDGLTLGQVMASLKKDYNFNVRYTDENLQALKIKGTLDSRQGFEEMLQTIAFALQVTIEPDGTNSYRISR